MLLPDPPGDVARQFAFEGPPDDVLGPAVAVLPLERQAQAELDDAPVGPGVADFDAPPGRNPVVAAEARCGAIGRLQSSNVRLLVRRSPALTPIAQPLKHSSPSCEVGPDQAPIEVGASLGAPAAHGATQG